MNRKLIFFIMPFLLLAFPLNAQLFRPFQSFRVIHTEKFDIIYPDESENTARLLSTYADIIYNEVSEILDIQVPGRIPVTFAPNTDLFNGYYRPIPSPGIVLYDTAMDLEWTTFEDNLKGLFLHELVHAITLNTRSSFMNALRNGFGYWATPSLWTSPLFMTEGATISFESLTGFGRANDPLTKHVLRQAIHENKFLTPFQASGVYDGPGQNGVFYEYGGLFSAWLQNEYGMEKYAQLWRAMGSLKSTGFSFFVYRSVFYNAFRRTYEFNFMDAWNSFRESLVINDIEDAPGEILPAQYSFLTKKRGSFSALAARGGNVYILDGGEEKIRVYNEETGRVRVFDTSSINSNDIDVSPCGNYVLVSGYHVTGSMFSAVVTEHRVSSGFVTGRRLNGIYKARYFRDGVIGIGRELHNNRIVFMDFNGNTEVLFQGNERLMFSGPQVVDDDRIVFIAARDGIRELMLYNYATGELFRIENTNDNNEYWKYMRGLNVSDGNIFFSYNSDDRMYKLAGINADSMRATFSGRDFSGGVFNPVGTNGNIYYRANFFSGDSILRFPETVENLTGTNAALKLQAVPCENYGKTASPVLNSIQIPEIESKPYFGIRYMNPFDFWLPMLLLSLSLDEDMNFKYTYGLGLFSMINDPTNRNVVTMLIYADISNLMLRVDAFSFQTTVPGFPVALEFADYVDESFGYIPRRITSIGLGAGFSFMPGRVSFDIGLGGSYVSVANDSGGISAYEWKQSGHAAQYYLTFSMSNRIKRQHEFFGTGAAMSIRGLNVANLSQQQFFNPRAEAQVRFSAETRFPLNFNFYGAVDEDGMNLYGASRYYTDTLFKDHASIEYADDIGYNLSWICGGEISLGLFSWEIQKNISHLYFNRITGTLSVRNVLYDASGINNAAGISLGNLNLAQSLVLKLSLVPTILPIKTSPISFEVYGYGAWLFSNTITGSGNQFVFGMDVKFSF
ncbi:MAG: hypothetical protein FWC01_03495 [Treponema sp.]|nr:hypothetical protein [Treponema sp.]MCL2237070.1 hypothetical protein [Treponema sp.]